MSPAVGVLKLAMPFLDGLLVLECLLPFFLPGDIGSLSGVELALEDALLPLECSSSEESEESPLNGVLRICAACCKRRWKHQYYWKIKHKVTMYWLSQELFESAACILNTSGVKWFISTMVTWSLMVLWSHDWDIQVEIHTPHWKISHITLLNRECKFHLELSLDHSILTLRDKNSIIIGFRLIC